MMTAPEATSGKELRQRLAALDRQRAELLDSWRLCACSEAVERRTTAFRIATHPLVANRNAKSRKSAGSGVLFRMLRMFRTL
jgi:hypothetical protein